MRHHGLIALSALPVLGLACALTGTATPQETAVPVIGAEGQGEPLVCETANWDARAAYNRGMTEEANGQFDAAIAAFREAVERDPGYCDAMDNLGLLLRREGEIEEAIEWYRRSLAIASENPVALMNLGAALQMQGDLEAAEDVFASLAEVAPENPEGHYGLGTLDLDGGKPADAIPHLLVAEALYRASGSVWEADADFQLGIAYALTEECDTALDYFEPLYASNRDNPELNWYMGVCYLSPEAENLDLAKKHLQEAQRLGIVIPADLIWAIE